MNYRGLTLIVYHLSHLKSVESSKFVCVNTTFNLVMSYMTQLKILKMYILNNFCIKCLNF